MIGRPLGLCELLVERRLRRWARCGESVDDYDEPMVERPCEACGTNWYVNTEIFLPSEPYRCEDCAPDEHYMTAYTSEYLDDYLRREKTKEQM